MIKGNSIHGGIFVIEIAKSCQNRYCNKDVFLVEKLEQIFLILISQLAKNTEVQNHLPIPNSKKNLTQLGLEVRVKLGRHIGIKNSLISTDFTS